MFDAEKNVGTAFSSSNTTQCFDSKFNLTINSGDNGYENRSATETMTQRDSMFQKIIRWKSM